MSVRNRRHYSRPFVVGFLLTLVSCTAKDPSPTTAQPLAPPNSQISNPAKPRTAAPIWPLAEGMVTQSALAAEELSAAIEQLLTSPNLDNHKEVRDIWQKTAGHIEAFHVFAGIGKAAQGAFIPVVELQFNLAAWPIEPGYLDGFADHPYSGLVFDVGAPLTQEYLREQHGMTANSDATLGLYAMEVLLFGEYNDRSPLMFTPLKELSAKHVSDGFENVAELPRNRRRQLVHLQGQLLADDVARLRTLISDKNPDGIPVQFNHLGEDAQLQLIQKAALLMATEHMVAIAKQQTSVGSMPAQHSLWQGQQLALRLRAQLSGWLLLLHAAPVPFKDEITGASQQAIAALTAVLALPPLQASGAPQEIDWKESYQSARQLSQTLSPGFGKEEDKPAVTATPPIDELL